VKNDKRSIPTALMSELKGFLSVLIIIL